MLDMKYEIINVVIKITFTSRKFMFVLRYCCYYYYTTTLRSFKGGEAKVYL